MGREMHRYKVATDKVPAGEPDKEENNMQTNKVVFLSEDQVRVCCPIRN
jgi:hypothetical protein